MISKYLQVSISIISNMYQYRSSISALIMFFFHDLICRSTDEVIIVEAFLRKLSLQRETEAHGQTTGQNGGPHSGWAAWWHGAPRDSNLVHPEEVGMCVCICVFSNGWSSSDP